jgi:hypothetical protein
MLGRCSACEDYVEASRYLDVRRQEQEVEKLTRENKLSELEATRRVELIGQKKLEPFGPQ